MNLISINKISPKPMHLQRWSSSSIIWHAGILRAGLLVAFVVMASVWTGCLSSSYRMKLLRKSSNVAVYVVAHKKFPEDDSIRKELPQMIKIPNLSRGQVKAILGNLRFKKISFWGNRRGRVFYPAELESAVNLVLEIIPTLQSNEKLVLVTRHDPDHSVLSRMERVTLAIWADTSGLNLVFGEIREAEEPKEDYEDDSWDDWTDIEPIDFSEPAHTTILYRSDSYSFKRILKKRHRTWAVFNLAMLDKLVYKIPKRRLARKSGQKQSNEPLSKEQKDLKRKHVLLQKAFKEGLITRKEYNKKIKSLRKASDIKRLEALLKSSLKEGLISRKEYDEKIKKLHQGIDTPRAKDKPEAKPGGGQ